MMKYYFSEIDEERCYTLKHIREMMEEENITEMDIFEAKIETRTGTFYCREFGEVGIVGEGCGKFCDKYAPRNGKNGRCRYSSNCYIPTDKVKHIKIKL
jgi:hypothetical protein